jgi:hypothetical protein
MVFRLTPTRASDEWSGKPYTTLQVILRHAFVCRYTLSGDSLVT